MRKESYSLLNEIVDSIVKFGSNTNIPILRKVHLSIKLKDGSHNFISNAFYAPGLHHNLLSMGQLSKKGYNMQIHLGYCIIFDRDGRFITEVNMTSNKLFPLKMQHEIFFLLEFGDTR